MKCPTLPHSLSDTSPPTPAPMSAPTLPPLRPASELQAAQRKRAATMPGKSIRQSTNSGPKVVACNFCRGKRNCRYEICFTNEFTLFVAVRPSVMVLTLPVRAALVGSWSCNYVHHDSIPNGSPQKKARRTIDFKNHVWRESFGFPTIL
jgi:hypothetical protein